MLYPTTRWQVMGLTHGVTHTLTCSTLTCPAPSLSAYSSLSFSLCLSRPYTHTRTHTHNSASGIELAGGGNVVISNNIIGDNGISRPGSGVLVRSGVSDFSVTGNSIGSVRMSRRRRRGAGSVGGGDDGDGDTGEEAARVSGNRVPATPTTRTARTTATTTTTTRYGVEVERGTSDHYTIVGNTVSGNQLGGISDLGQGTTKAMASNAGA